MFGMPCVVSVGEDGVVRVAFVCLGNICRSPAGEAILRAKVTEAGLSDAVTVEAFGPAGGHLGAGAHEQTLASLGRAGSG